MVCFGTSATENFPPVMPSSGNNESTAFASFFAALDRTFLLREHRAYRFRDRLELVGVFENPRFVFEPAILARSRSRFFDLADDVTQIIRASLSVGTSRGNRCNLAANAR